MSGAQHLQPQMQYSPQPVSRRALHFGDINSPDESYQHHLHFANSYKQQKALAQYLSHRHPPTLSPLPASSKLPVPCAVYPTVHPHLRLSPLGTATSAQFATPQPSPVRSNGFVSKESSPSHSILVQNINQGSSLQYERSPSSTHCQPVSTPTRGMSRLVGREDTKYRPEHQKLVEGDEAAHMGVMSSPGNGKKEQYPGSPLKFLRQRGDSKTIQDKENRSRVVRRLPIFQALSDVIPQPSHAAYRRAEPVDHGVLH